MGEGSNKVLNTWVRSGLGQWLHQEHQQAWGNTWMAPFTRGNTLPPPNAPHTQFTLGRNQATTATAGRQSCSSAAKRETNVTHLDDKDWGKVALPGPGWWRTREVSTTQGAEAHASIPTAPPCPMQLTQALPIPHLDTPPIHLSYLSSSPRSYPPTTTMQQSPALLTQANCPYTTFCLFRETEGWGFTLNHHSFVKLPKTNLNKTFWGFEWGGSPHFKIKCNGRPLTFLAAYFAGNTCPPHLHTYWLLHGELTCHGETCRELICESHTQTANKHEGWDSPSGRRHILACSSHTTQWFLLPSHRYTVEPRT